MPIWKCSLRKAFGAPFNVKWSNTYYIDAGTALEAGDVGYILWTEGERTFHTAGIYCYEMYLNNLADPPNSPGQIYPIAAGDQRGTFPGYNAGATFPLWNTLRVDFSVTASRPSRKFYRLGLVPANYDNGNITAGLAGVVDSGCEAIAGNPFVVDVDGQNVFAHARKGLTPHRLGKEAGLNVPAGPAFG